MSEEGDQPGLLLLLLTLSAVAACGLLGYRAGFAETGDFHLALGAGAIDAGISVAIPVLLCLFRRFRGARRFTILTLVVSLAHLGFAVAHPTETAAQRLAHEAREINTTAPKMADKETRIDGATLGPGLMITVRKTLVSLDGKSVAPSAWTSGVAPKIRSKALLNKGFRNLLSQGAVVVYLYAGRDGVPIGTLRLSRDDLGGNR
ncbi:MAG TPA: hypothetical protein VGF85_03980 [Opitutaceae bacterium]